MFAGFVKTYCRGRKMMQEYFKEKSVLEIRSIDGKLLFILNDPKVFNRDKPLKIILTSETKEDVRYIRHTPKNNLVMQ